MVKTKKEVGVAKTVKMIVLPELEKLGELDSEMIKDGTQALINNIAGQYLNTLSVIAALNEETVDGKNKYQTTLDANLENLEVLSRQVTYLKGILKEL